MEDKILEKSDVGALPLLELKKRWYRLITTKMNDDLREKNEKNNESDKKIVVVRTDT
jgi:hypothetical protein